MYCVNVKSLTAKGWMRKTKKQLYAKYSRCEILQIKPETKLSFIVHFFHYEIRRDVNIRTQVQLLYFFLLKPFLQFYAFMHIKINKHQIYTSLLFQCFWTLEHICETARCLYMNRTNWQPSLVSNETQSNVLLSPKPVFSLGGIEQYDLYPLYSSSLGLHYLKTNKVIYFKSHGTVG